MNNALEFSLHCLRFGALKICFFPISHTDSAAAVQSRGPVCVAYGSVGALALSTWRKIFSYQITAECRNMTIYSGIIMPVRLRFVGSVALYTHCAVTFLK